MKIAFLTYGVSPVPATKGGAIENLIESLIKQNEMYNLEDFTVFGLWEKNAYEISKRYKNTSFEYVKCPRRIEYFDKIIYWVSKNILKRCNLISYRYILQRLYVIQHYPKLLLRDNYDCVILVNNSTLFYILKNKKVQKKYSNKTIYYLHNEVRSLFHLNSEAKLIRALIGVSNYVNNDFCNKVDFPLEKTFILRNCIDRKRFNNIDYKKMEKYKKKFGIKEEDFVVLFVGRIVREKGVIETIEAVKKCARQNMKLLIVGGSFYSTDVIDPYFDIVRNASKEMGKNVIFAGYIDYNDMPEIYKIANVAVFPSLWNEPAGMTMIEAMISGVPLITTDAGGITEYVPQNASIILQRDNNLVEEISNSIIRIMDDAEYSNELSTKGKEMGEVYNLDKFYFDFCNIVNSIFDIS